MLFLELAWTCVTSMAFCPVFRTLVCREAPAEDGVALSPAAQCRGLCLQAPVVPTLSEAAALCDFQT